MDFMGFDFTPAAVVALLGTAWGVGLVLGGIAAVLSSVAGRR